MAYEIKQDIVVPNNYVKNLMGLVPPFRQGHFHSTGNKKSSVQNERDYLAGHYQGANYTHLVGITNGEVDIRQVMNTNGGAFDVGGDWNWETWFAIEFVEGSIVSQEDFKKAYKAYVWLGRYLAQQAGIPITIDTPDIAGLKTHNYASKTGHGSDHVDPIGFLASWGVSYDQFKNDVLNGIGENDEVVITPAQQAPTSAPQPQTTSAIQQFKNNGNRFTAFKTFRVDDIKKVNGIWQVANYWLSGGKDGFDWTLHGIPWAILDNTTRSNAVNIQVGDMVKFDENNNSGTIDKYDPASNGVGIIFGKYGIIWFDADAFLVL